MMKLILIAALLLIVGGYFVMSLRGQQLPENVTLADLSGAVLESDPDLLVVDIRTPEEWKQTGVVRDALLVTYTTPESFLEAVNTRKTAGQTITLICRSGNRSSNAARQIAELVEGDVIDVAGGMNRVLREGYDPVKPTREMGCMLCE